MKKYVVIVAGGKGLRMGADIPKQFLMIGGKPVLVRTIEAFHSYDPAMQIILVLPQEQQPYWAKLCDTYDCCIPYSVADGGETRFHSVRNGLALVGSEGLVAIHDGVRPFVSCEVIDRCFEVAREKKAVVPVIDIFESVRKVEAEGSFTVPRNDYKLVQTPQIFTTGVLKRAYEQAYDSSFTDDASVVEASGVPVTLVTGNRENIKITTPYDLKIANALI